MGGEREKYRRDNCKKNGNRKDGWIEREWNGKEEELQGLRNREKDGWRKERREKY